MHRLLRLTAAGTLLAGALLANFAAKAQDTAGYPARPVKIIVPFAPAGPPAGKGTMSFTGRSG